MSVKMIVDTNELKKYIDNYQSNAEKAINATLGDFRRRAPGWIADEVRKEYNIKKSEIMPAKSGKREGKAADIKISGDTIETMELVYTGRPLTPLHFSMTPKKPPALTERKNKIPGQVIKTKSGENIDVGMARARKKYTITLQIKKGKREKLTGKREYGTPPFIATAARGSATMIPFQRSPGNKYPVTAIHTVSVPQMIDNKEVREGINKAINDKLKNRFEHYTERYLGR